MLSGELPIATCSTEPIQGSTDGILTTSQSTPIPAFSLLIDGQWVCGTGLFQFRVPITPAEGLYCASLLEQAATSQSVSCVPPAP
jgi:hypothetical protein